MLNTPFSIEDVFELATLATIERAQEYVRQQRVISIVVQEETLLGRVLGSGKSMYHQCIELADDDGNVYLEGGCSCPVGYNCKHVVAVLIQYLEDEGIPTEVSFTRAENQAHPSVALLPRLIGNWLQRVEDELVVKPMAMAMQSVPAPVASAHRLVFALVPVQNGKQVLLSLCKARLRKDGRFSSVKPLSDSYNFFTAMREFEKEIDQDAVSLFLALLNRKQQSAPYYQSQSQQNNCELSGKLGAQLLRLLLEKNNLLWANSPVDLSKGQAHFLSLSPPRTATLEWDEQRQEESLDEPRDAPHMKWARPAGKAAKSPEMPREVSKLVWKFASDSTSATDIGTDLPSERGETIDYVLPTVPPWYINNLSCGELTLPSIFQKIAQDALINLVAQAPLLDAGNKLQVAQLLLAQGVSDVIPLPVEVPFSILESITPQPRLVLGNLPFDKGVRGDFAQLSFVYDRMIVSAQFSPSFQRNGASGIERIIRNQALENAAHQLLLDHHFHAVQDSEHFSGPRQDAFLMTEEAAWLRFAKHGIPALSAAGWRIDKTADYRFDLTDIDDWYADIQEASADQQGNPWFDLALGIVINNERVSLLPLLIDLIRQAPDDFNQRALAQRDDSDEFLVELESGQRVALPWGRIKPILTTLGELYFTDKLGDSVRLSVLDAARLAELEGSAELRWMGGERLRQLGQKLNSFGGVQQVAVPDGLQASLRDYQREGLSWMQFLREYDFAGILADDMGLGKTIQALAHILIEKNAGRLTSPALIVAPTSLMANWREEAERFAPSLKVLVLQGKERLAYFDHIGDYDVVLTTYALLPRDEERLRAHDYHLLILDEAHYIKNARSKAAQSAALIKARHRLCLTGTPLENHLGELWSQFHFLLPGLLGSEKDFNRDFRTPIEKYADDDRRALLVRRIKPFLLRRTKDAVASELPPKTEMVRHVELSGAQRDLYETVRLAMDKKVRAAIESKGVARSQIIILEALLKLRQACCDPRLVKTTKVEDGRTSTVPSAKLLELMEMVVELREEDRRILIFSQFTSMLALIAEALTAVDISYALLTGETKDRAAVVRSFQSGEVPVFLISLKAGGVGLNLTAADTVIHYDPWWNPAAELQATDRAWRIGQDKPVFVYKLIAKGTVEEKIQALQGKKAALANAILGTSGEALSLKLTAEDLQAIFAPLD
ncbi:DEAD/DEAH box helicase [Glaciimonas sp. GG7]